MNSKPRVAFILIIILFLGICGCSQRDPQPAEYKLSNTATVPPLVTKTATIPKINPSPSATPIKPSNTPPVTPTTEADGCRKPSDNYEHISINGFALNQRTYDMLVYASSLYGGVIDITGQAITQGSYTSAVEASFGTHAGGGAVDLSVMVPGTYTIHKDDIEPLIRALRLAGFAAWYRDFDALYEGSPVHIHAIAIGDQELSPAARDQLTGPHGYFNGNNGLPTQGETPAPDPHDGPIICEWMVELGYPFATTTPVP